MGFAFGFGGFSSTYLSPAPFYVRDPDPGIPSTKGRQPDAVASEAAPPRTRAGKDPAVTPTDVAYIAPLNNGVVHAVRCVGSFLQYKTAVGADTVSLVSILWSLERSLAPASSGPDYTLIAAAVDGALLHDGHRPGTCSREPRPSSSLWHGVGPARSLTVAMPNGPRTGVSASSFPGSTPGRNYRGSYTTKGTITAGGSSWPHATEICLRTFGQVMSPAEPVHDAAEERFVRRFVREFFILLLW